MRMLYTLKYTPGGHYVLEFTISVDNVFLLANLYSFNSKSEKYFLLDAPETCFLFWLSNTLIFCY